MARSTIRPTIANSTNSIASICRTCIRRWARLRPIILPSPSWQAWLRPVVSCRRPHYIHPRITGDMVRYFEWMGAAHYTADRRSGAMHGKVFLLDSIYAGIDENNVYGRVDFAGEVPDNDCEIVFNLESWAERSSRPRRGLRLNVQVKESRIASWNISDNGDQVSPEGAGVALGRNFEFKLPLALLYAQPPESTSDASSPAATKIRLASQYLAESPADGCASARRLD